MALANCLTIDCNFCPQEISDLLRILLMATDWGALFTPDLQPGILLVLQNLGDDSTEPVIAAHPKTKCFLPSTSGFVNRKRCLPLPAAQNRFKIIYQNKAGYQPTESTRQNTAKEVSLSKQLRFRGQSDKYTPRCCWDPTSRGTSSSHNEDKQMRGTGP